MARSASRPRPAAFTLIESVVACAIVGGLLVSVLGAVATAAAAQRRLADTVRGELIAEDLLAEVLIHRYEDELLAGVAFGPESGETGANRAKFDDVDDFNGWSESPPVDRDGAAINGFSGWARTVQVEWVDPATLVVSPTEKLVKRVTVTVSRSGIQVARAVGFRTTASPYLVPEP